MKRFKEYLEEKREPIMVDADGRKSTIMGLYNPKSESEIVGLLNRNPYKVLRFIWLKKERECYVWDAEKANHDEVSIAYGYDLFAGKDWDWGLVFQTVKDKKPAMDVGNKSILPDLKRAAPGFKNLPVAEMGTV